MGPRGDLVDEHAAIFRDKELDAGHPDHVEGHEDSCGDVDGSGMHRFRQAGRHARDVEDVAGVGVAGGSKGHGRAIEPAGRHHRDLAVEIDPALEHALPRSAGASAKCDPGWLNVVRCHEHRLSLAVVAEGGRLEHGGQADHGHGRLEFCPRADEAVRCTGKAMPHEKLLLAAPVLGREQHLRVGPNGHDRGERLASGRRHVLKLERDNVEAGGCRREEGRVVVAAYVQPVAVPGGRAVGHVGNRLHAIAHPPGGHREHAAELAAAENAERGSGQDRPGVDTRASCRRHGYRSDVFSDQAVDSPVRSSRSTRAVCSAR